MRLLPPLEPADDDEAAPLLVGEGPDEPLPEAKASPSLRAPPPTLAAAAAAATAAVAVAAAFAAASLDFEGAEIEDAADGGGAEGAAGCCLLR